MRKEMQPVYTAMAEIVNHPRASRIEKIEASKLILSLFGILLPEIDERWLSVRQLTELRRWKRDTVEKVLRKKEIKRKANRKAYLRRQIKQLERNDEPDTN